MAIIDKIELFQIDLTPKVKRTDAIQSFVKQETPMMRVFTDDGLEGAGYAYTIGTGGSSVMALLRDHLAPRLLGRDPAMVEMIWKDLFFHTHATAVGAITSLALAVVDTALWDLRAKRAGEPIHKIAGGAQKKVPLYTTEGGWLHLTPEEVVDDTLRARAGGFRGAKIKVGHPHVAQDTKRLAAVRKAVGGFFDIMVDANQCFTVPEAIRRARAYEEFDLAWLEEPLPAEDMSGHARLAASTATPIAVGESIYHPSHFREYLAAGACSIVQADVARIGGITPWLKVAHMAEGFNIPIAPHFLMELHVSLCAAVPNAAWVEYIPQLDDVTDSVMRIDDGYAVPPAAPGLGIAWNWKKVEKRRIGGVATFNDRRKIAPGGAKAAGKAKRKKG